MGESLGAPNKNSGEAMLQSFPPHVRREWFDAHPSISGAKRLLLPADTVLAIRLESKITPQELIDVVDLRNREAAIDQKLKTEKPETFFSSEYRRLYAIAREQGPTEHVLREALALSIAAAKHAYGTAGKPFDVWGTQRIAMLRITKNLLQAASPGLVADLRTGMGKSAVVAMITIPVGLMVKDHWDVVSRTPLSRMDNARRFSALGDLLGIKNAEVTESSTCIWKNGRRGTYISLDPKRDVRTIAMKDNQVTFATRPDIASYILTHYAGGQFRTLQDIVRPARRGCIVDEIDAAFIDEASHLLIISGPAEETPGAVRVYWEPTAYPKDTTDSDIPSKRISRRLYTKHMSRLQRAMENDVHRARAALGENTAAAGDENTAFSFALLQKIFSFEDELRRQDRFQIHRPFFTPDGRLTADGQYDLLRRFYSSVAGIPYNSQELIPQEWDKFLSILFPAHIIETIGAGMRLRPEKDYFIKDRNIVVQSPLTGWPRPRQEFDPLTTFALYAKESLRAQLDVPTTLHETADAFSSPELDAIFYTKMIGLTGTGLQAADWFRRVRGMDITACPPEFAETIDDTDPYIVVRNGETKKQHLEDYLKALPDPSVPVLIDVSSRQEQQTAVDLLQTLYPDDRIQVISAVNAQDAQEKFDKAGQPGMKTVVLLMAGREVDILVDDALEHIGGLRVVSMSPRTLARSEQQLKGRTGRAGKSGAYRCLVSADDEVFALLTPDQQKKAAQYIRGGNTEKIKQVIARGQQKHEERLREQNAAFERIYGPLVLIRRRMLRLSPAQFDAVTIFWQDFLTLNQTWGASLGFLTPPTGLKEHQVNTLWKHHVVGMFETALARTTELMEQSKTTTAMTRGRMRDIIGDEMGAAMNNFGFSVGPISGT